jgi:hypothetical protein
LAFETRVLGDFLDVRAGGCRLKSSQAHCSSAFSGLSMWFPGMNRSKKIFAIVAALVLGPAMIYVGAREFLSSRKLAREGRETTARVVDQERSHRRKGGTKYYLTVTFEPEQGQATTRRLEVDHSVYEEGGQAGAVLVHYLPSDPKVCQAGAEVETKFGLLLIGFLILGAGGYLVLFFKQPVDDREAAQAIADQVDGLANATQELVPAQPHQFGHLDLAYYDQSRQILESKGFTFLGDEEDLAFRRRTKARVLLRVLRSRDGTMAAGLYHFRPHWTLRILGAEEVKVLDLETWFADGTFLCTTNAAAAGALRPPPEIDTCYLPAGTPIETVLEAHGRRLCAKLAAPPNTQPVLMRSLADVRQAQAEHHRLTTEFRKRAGITPEELARLAGSSNSKRMGGLHAQVVKIQQDRQRKVA